MPNSLSLAQQRQWLLEKLAPGDAANSLWAAYRIGGPLDTRALKQSLSEIMQRHETLHTTFIASEGQAVPVLSAQTAATLPIIDLQELSPADREAEARRWAAEEAQRPFDLAQGPPIRAALLSLSPQEHVFVLTVHRIAADSESVDVLRHELGMLYGAATEGEPSPLDDLPLQYAGTCELQQEWLQSEAAATELGYWKEQLGGDLPLLELAADRPRTPGHTRRETHTSATLSPASAEALKDLSREQNRTLFVTLLAAFQALLCRRSGEHEIAVATRVSGRHRPHTEGLVGPLANTLVLRSDLSGEPAFRDLLDRVQEVVSGALAHQELPFEALVQELHPARDPNRAPFTQVGFQMRAPAAGQLALPGLQVEPFPVPERHSDLDLTLYAQEQGDQLAFTLAYNADVYSERQASELLEQYRELLAQVVERPDLSIGAHSLVTSRARQLLPDPSQALPEPWHEPITVFFESWTAPGSEIGGRPAIRNEHRSWTYRELGERARALAHVLGALGVQRGDTVAVTGARSFGLIASMAGVLWSGGVLLNIDPNLPRRRQELMLQEAKARTVLYGGTPRAEDTWMWETLTVLRIDAESGQAIDRPEGEPADGSPLPRVSPEDAAYLFFTSGTTGVPKGVLGCHKGLSHFLAWQRQCFAIGPSDRSAQLTGISFDVVLRDIFTPLTAGATLCLPSEADRLEPARLLSWMERERITMLHTVPSLAQTWLAHVPLGVSLSTLRWAFSAGEPLTDTLVKRWREAFPEAGQMINIYGPTETTMAKCYFEVPDKPLPGVQPVGWTLPETQALVLTQDRQLCGIGEPGEIVIRTPFRTLGYVNATEENEKRFVRNPFRDDERDLLYLTGDRGRYRPDGSLNILGRVDHQVKIRGVRIELGGIETVIGEHPDVWNTVVIVREDVPGDKRLAAYVTAKPGQAIRPHELRQFVKQKLPDAMVPSAFVVLDTLPLTANGKVDRKALPAPEGLRQELDETYVAPRTELERTIAAIWQDVLRIDKAGVDDNFFDLGGHSLLLVQVQSKLNSTLHRDIPVVDLFKHSTISTLSRHLSEGQEERSSLDRVQDRTEQRKALMRRQVQSRMRVKLRQGEM
jgi:amino acid adenylation domain-containing protein